MDKKVKEKLEKFFSKYKLQSYKKGEILIRSDDSPPGVFYLVEGIIRRYAVSLKGEELTLNIYKTPSFFPMSWVLNDSPNKHYYEAMTEAKVWRAPKDDMLNFIKKDPEILLDLAKRIFNGLEGLFLRLENLMVGSAKARVVAELLIYARRFGHKQEKGILVTLKLNEKDLASQAGVARETVSREIQKLKHKGLISYKSNTLLIKDMPRLETELLGVL